MQQASPQLSPQAADVEASSRRRRDSAAAAAGAATAGLDLSPWLSELSPDRDLESAASAPELLALAMLKHLKVSADQARALLADDARRLARAFVDGHERNCAHLSRWLEVLSCYSGPLAELLMLEPTHIAPILRALGHGLRSASAVVAEGACWVLAGACRGLADHQPSRSLIASWLLESPVLPDLVSFLGRRPQARSPAAEVVACCSAGTLLPALAQHLKQASRGEQEYLSTVHLLLQCYLEQQNRPIAEACFSQGVVSHFLLRCIQRFGDEWSTPGTQQAAALLACDLWLAGCARQAAGASAAIAAEEASNAAVLPPEAFADLLSALKQMSQSKRSRTLQLLAFSCLARLLSTLCDRCDPENTPAVYRTFVYALVEAESPGVRDFAMRNLMALLKQYPGVPVGILVEPTMKKFQTAQEALSLVDIELFLVIVKHPRCTANHAEMLARVLGRASAENRDYGRAASVPLLAIISRFADDSAIGAFFEAFVRICLTRLINRGVDREQCVLMQEVLAKAACLQIPRLEKILRTLLTEISRAYLTSYESLHPNLQALLELWPADDTAVTRWAQRQFAPEPDRRASPEDGDRTDGGLILESVNPSVRSESRADAPADTAAGGAQAQEDDGAAAAVPIVHVQRLARETEALRDDLEEAKAQQKKAVEEAEVLRRKLEEAQREHSKIEQEVGDLSRRRQELLDKRGNSKRPGGKAGASAEEGAGAGASAGASAGVPRRDKQRRGKTTAGGAAAADAAAAAGPEASEAVAELLKAFTEPLAALFSAYAHPIRTKLGKRQAVTVEGLDQLLVDVELLVPGGKMPKKASQKAVRSAGVKTVDDTLVFSDFLAMLPHTAALGFAPGEAVPFRDFGVAVPVEEQPAVVKQAQAFVQHLQRWSETSRSATARILRPLFEAGRRRWALSFARKKVEELNGRLKRGEELKVSDLPEGFEVQIRRPAPTYAVPSGFPVPLSERHCAEILDEILAEALGVHFLEPLGDAKPVPQAVVKGYPNLDDLAPQRTQRSEQAPASNNPRRAQHQQQHPSDPPTASAGVVETTALPRRPEPAARQQRSQEPRERSNGPREASSERQQQQPPPQQPRSRPQQPQQRQVQQQPPQSNRPQQAQPKQRQQPQRSPPQPQQKASGSARRELSHDSTQKKPTGSGVANATQKPQHQARARSQPREVASGGDEANLDPGVGAGAAGRNASKHKVIERHHSAAELGKARQDAIKKTLKADDVNKLLKNIDVGLRKAFEFFARWKGSSDTMNVAGFLVFGECFSLLDKEALKKVFKQVGGNGLDYDAFPEALLHCLVRILEASASVDADDSAQWPKHFRALLVAHMLLGKPKDLQAIMDKYRRAGDVLPKFDPAAPPAPPPARSAAAGAGSGAGAGAAGAGAPASPSAVDDGGGPPPAEEAGASPKAAAAAAAAEEDPDPGEVTLEPRQAGEQAADDGGAAAHEGSAVPEPAGAAEAAGAVEAAAPSGDPAADAPAAAAAGASAAGSPLGAAASTAPAASAAPAGSGTAEPSCAAAPPSSAACSPACRGSKVTSPGSGSSSAAAAAAAALGLAPASSAGGGPPPSSTALGEAGAPAPAAPAPAPEPAPAAADRAGGGAGGAAGSNFGRTSPARRYLSMMACKSLGLPSSMCATSSARKCFGHCAESSASTLALASKIRTRQCSKASGKAS
eukprot:TRINITY_DN7411_c0_g1_i4.p1 TRINITY_DN7411_c0_g1~~TRINITY_DN7411_c0_g1_i4.p1  ORF type:complete len:1970 (-),score=512.64 TRINITY_DN7411_c0_g1_i4:238-5274(-)